MKRISISLILCCILSCLCVAAPQLPGNCTAGLPSLLLKKTVKESEVNALVKSGKWGQTNKLHKYWTVYSDRSHNTTYNAPSTSGGKCDELDFNEQIRIAKIENGFALVYTENQKGVIYPLVSSNAKSRGWIPMDNLLLWSSCPTTELGVFRKAFIRLAENSEMDEYTGNLYSNPNTKEFIERLITGQNVFFVMKKADNGLVLLARECKMEGYTYAVLYGWVSTSSILPWDNRLCIEPNWLPSAVEKLKGKKVNVSIRERSPITVEIGIPSGKVNNLTTKYRWTPEKMRYPLLGDQGTQFSIISFARPPGVLEESVINAYYGFTEKKDEETEIDYWQPVIFISSDEFAQLMEKLQPVMSAANTGNRKPYVDAMKELTRSMIPDITPKEMDEKDVKEIMALVAGLNVKSGSLGGRTLIQIQDENVVKQDEFDGMIADFQNKFRKLKKIRKNKYDFSIERNKTTWYWIPVEDLP